MKFITLLLFIFLNTTQFCISSKAETNQPASIVQSTPTETKLKKRAKSPAIKIKKEFQIESKELKPYLITQTEYDKNGAVLLVKNFDFFGSGKQVGSTVSKYSSKGNLISSTQKDDGQTTNYSYKYNDKNQKTEETWSRKNGQGETTKFSYDTNGNIIEQKYFTLEGKHDFSRVTEYEYDGKGNIVSEKKWEKYTDGSSDLLQYHFVQEYKEGKLIKKTRLTERGKPDRIEEYTYDDNGLKTLELESSARMRSKTVVVYNEYGENVETKIYSIAKDDTESLDIHSTTAHDKYGNIIGYSYLKGSSDSEGTKFEYEFYD